MIALRHPTPGHGSFPQGAIPRGTRNGHPNTVSKISKRNTMTTSRAMLSGRRGEKVKHRNGLAPAAPMLALHFGIKPAASDAARSRASSSPGEFLGSFPQGAIPRVTRHPDLSLGMGSENPVTR